MMQLISLLGWLAIPVAIICMVDDWFLRPRRQIAAAPQPISDPVFMRALYVVLPVLIGAAVIRLLAAEQLDFSLVLVLISAATGLAWLLEVSVFRPMRTAAARAAGKDPQQIPEPGTADYARSFFPVAIVVLVLRSFIFEPFRIPSDSMMPTLLDGDFIIVNKYAYGLRAPVINRKIMPIGEPQRGDVVVFRYPINPSINYIKRLVGLPGDRVVVHGDRLVINGKTVPFEVDGEYNDGCYVNMHLADETLGAHRHRTLFCPVPLDIRVTPPSACSRSDSRGYYCGTEEFRDPEVTVEPRVIDVPPGHYLMIGDNRDNSEDGRVWGFVPEDHLVGKATRIWFNWDLQRSGGPVWSRIFQHIE